MGSPRGSGRSVQHSQSPMIAEGRSMIVTTIIHTSGFRHYFLDTPALVERERAKRKSPA
jgi:hypothetical protein